MKTALDALSAAHERSGKLSPINNAIRELECREILAKKEWAAIAVQLGGLYAQAKEVWLSDRGENSSWVEWITKHSSHNIRTIQVYMEMFRVHDAATETQRAALLERGSIRGFIEAAKQAMSEVSKESPKDISICDQAEKWAAKFVETYSEFRPASADYAREKLMPVVSLLWPEKFGA
jgi:hypothetical protein